MKGDIYYLIDSDGYVKAKFEQDKDYMSGKCYKACGWYDDKKSEAAEYEFFAEVYCKPDSCTHWYFLGEDYDDELKIDGESYYHLCGSTYFRDHIRLMCFIWYIAPIVIADQDTDIEERKDTLNYAEQYYNDDPLVQKIVEMMLEGYELKIEKALPKKEG